MSPHSLIGAEGLAPASLSFVREKETNIIGRELRENISSDALVDDADLNKQEMRYACPAGCSCSSNTIQCQNRGLTALPPMPTSGTTGVTHLYLWDNSLRELPDKALQYLSAVTYLGAHNNKVTLRLRKHSFHGLWNLVTLYLYNSNIEYLPDGVFYGLSKLTRLELNGNKLHRLQADAFNGLPLLATFTLHDNRSPLVVEDFAFRGAALQLTTLNLYGCQGIYLSPKAFYMGLFKVTRINLQKSKLAEVKAGTFQYQQLLKVVHLEDQGVGKELVLEPGAFNGSVQEIYLSETKLTTLPADLFSEGSEISKLDLSKNSLGKMPPGVFRPLKKLNYLDLRGSNSVDCLAIDELKEMTLSTLAYDSCRIYPAPPPTTAAPARPCKGGAIPAVLHSCANSTNTAAACGADPASNCCWVEVGGGFGLCIVNPSRLLL